MNKKQKKKVARAMAHCLEESGWEVFQRSWECKECGELIREPLPNRIYYCPYCGKNVNAKKHILYDYTRDCLIDAYKEGKKYDR